MRKTATGTSALRTRYALFAQVATWSLTTICVPNAESDSNLAQELTNPVASVIQVPFQNNFDWGGGPHNDAFRYTLNIQPVIPLSLNSDWNLIVRTIVPFASFDGLFPQTETGLAAPCKASFCRPPVRRRRESSGAWDRFFSIRRRRTPSSPGASGALGRPG